MEDREIVAAIAAGDPESLAEAYDEYAESLYGYCRWMLGEPEDSADAVQDTFVVAAERLGGLHDPRKLRPWLYAVARNECRRRGPAEAGPDSEAGRNDDARLYEDAGRDEDAGPPATAKQAELRRVVRVALDGLNSDEREVLELGLRHDLHGADLAAVLGVPRNQAHALVSRAHGRLEKMLGAVLVARTGRSACPELDLLLEDWDGRLTTLTRKRIGRHVDQCDICAYRRRGALRPAALYGMAPLAALPPELREEILGLCADVSPLGQSYRQEVTDRAGPFRPNGFPQPVRSRRPRLLALSGVAAAVGVVIAVAATGIITVLALTGSPARHPATASQHTGTPGPATASVTAGPGSAGGASPSLSPTISAVAVITAPPPAASSPSASPTKAKPSPSRSATSSAPGRPTPTPTPTQTTFTPASTPTATPTATFTATVTPTATVTSTSPGHGNGQ